MRTKRPRLFSTLARCALLRCPACGRSSIFGAPFRVRHHCPSCTVLFQREEGFFVGSIMINVVATEVLALVFYLVALQTIGFSEGLILLIALPLVLVLPIALYHHSWSAWVGLDHIVEGLPLYDGRGPGR